MVGRIIKGPDDIAEGMNWLAARDSRFADAYALTGPLPLRRKPEGFAELQRDQGDAREVEVSPERAFFPKAITARRLLSAGGSFCSWLRSSGRG